MTIRVVAIAAVAAVMAGSPVGAGSILQSRGALVTGAPTVHDIQGAYEDAKALRNGRHIDDLVLRDASCALVGGPRFNCQVDFVVASRPEGRLYFAVLTIDRLDHGWFLVSGLCKSP